MAKKGDKAKIVKMELCGSFPLYGWENPKFKIFFREFLDNEKKKDLEKQLKLKKLKQQLIDEGLIRE